MQVRVYYEDTDAGGVVYYANYLRFLERGRTEYLEKRGVLVADCVKRGFFFVIASVNIKYRMPAGYGDVLAVKSEAAKIKASSIIFSQTVLKGDCVVCEADVVMVCVNAGFRPVAIPEDIREKLAENTSEEKNGKEHQNI